MTNSYRGPATVLHNGTEIEVTADLTVDRSGALESWEGVLRAPGKEFWDVYQADSKELRLPDGRVGAFITRRYIAESDTLPITGSGAAPF
jgi:hypothetical protein